MEHECVAGLYQAMGKSVGEQFSTEDVSQIFCKVFHEPSNADEAHAAMMKISDRDSGWTCVGDNVLDVLREMEQERKTNEKLYWDHQLLHAGNHHNTLYMMETPIISDPYTIYHRIHSQTDLLQSSNMNRKKHLWSVRNVLKLRKAQRQSWARLVVEGLQSLLPSPQFGHSLEVKGQAWGCVTLSDVLLLVEVKYDVVSHLLYTEMLKEHYSQSVWETLLPWQQGKATEGLGDRAEEALESGDMLHLTELPGAFKIYRFQEQCWTAVSFMCELNMLRQREKNTLKAVAERLNTESLRLMCLYIRLATLRAQREKHSYGALLAARQSWETWPDINSPLRAEQAALLLQSEDNEHKEDLASDLPQQAVLQLLVLTQEQERKQLIKLVQGVSLGDVQRLGCTESPKEENTEKLTDLRLGCVKRLRQISNLLQTQTHCEPQLRDCALHLLIHLMKLQEVQASELLPRLLDQSTQALHSLQEEYRSAHQAQSLPNLLHLLTSEDPLESCLTIKQNSTLTQNISSENDKSYRNKSQEDHNSNTGTGNSNGEASDVNGEQAAGVCTGCGAVMADLPYLEVLCMSETASDAQKEEYEDGKTSTVQDSQMFEKQGSLITLAWSKPLDSDSCAETVDASPLQGQLSETVNDIETSNTVQTLCETSGEDQIQPVDQKCSTEQISSDERPINENEMSAQALVEDVQVTQLTSMTESSKYEQHDSKPETYDKVKDEGCPDGEEVELKKPELTESEDQNLGSGAAEIMRESTLTEKACALEPVSAMERERTMRSLVDMQKKVEQRQQRDRERQLLKVQERLSIIQNRKAEEDLLGFKDRLKLLTHNLPQEDITQQKAVVKERLEQLRRERSYILQSKRDKNTAGFKELLGPVVLQNPKIDEDTD